MLTTSTRALLCFAFAATAPAALVSFATRQEFADNTNIASALASANGVDFISHCPTNLTSNGNPAGCAPALDRNEYSSSSSNPVSLNFTGLTGFSIQGWSGTVSGSTQRLILYSGNYSHPGRGTLTYGGSSPNGVPTLSTRNTFDSNNSASTIRMRVNLPSGVTSFAMDLSSGCHLASAANVNYADPNGCDAGDNHLGSIDVKVRYADSTEEVLPTLQTQDPTSQGDFTFLGRASTDRDIVWVELTLPTGSYGSIVSTNFAYGQYTPTPEPSSLVLGVLGLGLLARFRFKRSGNSRRS